MVRSRLRGEQVRDQDFISELEFNDFFVTTVITGTQNDSNIITTFDAYFPGRGLITAGSSITVTTGTNFVEITGSGISLIDHEEIDSLVHNLAETQTTEIIRGSNNKVTNVEVRTAPSPGGILIRSTAITRVDGTVTQVVDNQHDTVGDIIQTLTSTINRTNGKVTSVGVVET